MLTTRRPTEPAPEPEVIPDAVRLSSLPGTDVMSHEARNYWVEHLGIKVGVDWKGVPSISAVDAYRVKRAADEAYNQHAEAQAAYHRHLQLRAEDARRRRVEAQREAAEREALRMTNVASALQEEQRRKAIEQAERDWQREQDRAGRPPSFDEFVAKPTQHEELNRKVQEELDRADAARQRRLAAQRGN